MSTVDDTAASAAPGELVLVRHGETAWSRAGRHTGRSDLPLTPDGEEQARATGRALAGREFALVLTSPLTRARRTAELAGYGGAEVEPDLAEWDYGPVEGLTRVEVADALGRGWAALTDGVRVPLTVSGTDDLAPDERNPEPGEGELIEEVAARAARVIARAETTLLDGGDVLLVAHGHLLRILTSVWLGLSPEVAERLVLGTAARCVLGYDRGARSLVHWNVAP
ncbi:histidine phosphatase family protein [Litorihabitans aurantiacus]|uniref:Phosphatase n=1 Tax=Litorihabitans aurantiacus TaxID=1930061 RepID=A0AA37UHC9_9MICO|nr:histidine phosphatase family protein [Litorihabitans aurantiacus]GMA30504.1 phosphatase [Litorihabitans aurantiacus]